MNVKKCYFFLLKNKPEYINDYIVKINEDIIGITDECRLNYYKNILSELNEMAHINGSNYKKLRLKNKN